MKIFFMDKEHIKNSVMDGGVRSGNCVRCKENYEYNQNDISDRNKSEVQQFKIVVDKEDKCKNMRQKNIARKYDINNITERQNNNDLSLKHHHISNLL